MDPAIKQMNVALLRYFQAEERAAALFIGLGAAAVALAAWFFVGEHPLRPALWPLAGIGLVQLAVGATVYFRTERQVRDLVGRLNSDPAAFRALEAGRMATVQRTFGLLRRLELILIALGLLLVLRGTDWAPWAPGVGWGLLVQSVVTFAFDHFAERRGAEYLAAIEGNLGG
ncbi:MAG: hypothetical protein SF066_10005 [Thermoanaerobaculia bacterium]|nr:hypothetical protein [Thermoanaerobaculia bacterium]